MLTVSRHVLLVLSGIGAVGLLIRHAVLAR